MRFDHAVIAVRDLASACDRMRAAGFDVQPGGRHVGFGTENAIVRFGLDYIELITVHDPAEAERASARSRALVEFLRREESGFVGYALAEDDLDGIADRLRSVGQESEGPTPMRRQRPDGSELRWRLLIPSGVAWRKVWPFFISWDVPDQQRLALERAGVHRIGATAIAGIRVATDDLPRTRALYETFLGLPTTTFEGRAVFRIGSMNIELVEREASGPDWSSGPEELTLRRRSRASQPVEVLPGVRFSFSP